MDPRAAEVATVDMDKARGALERAEAIYAEEGNKEPEQLEHEAYLARRYAETAVARADDARAQEEIENAELERTQVLLESRTAEAERRAAEAEQAQALASQRTRVATQAQQAAERAQIAAVSERARANDLAQQIAALEAEQTERGLVLTLGDVLFDTDEAQLKPGADSTLDELASFLDEYQERELLIEGHTDSRGSEGYNRDLSQQRAGAVRDALVDRGIDVARLHVRALGETLPVASNETAAGRQQNRRVEIVISDQDGEIADLRAATSGGSQQGSTD